MSDANGRAGRPIAAVVLNWNNESDTAACLDSLLAQEGVALELIVVDNASPDGSGERLRARYPSLIYLQTGANLGYAGGNNRGIEVARARGAEWILVVNNDTVADPSCVRLLRDAAVTDPRIAALAPLIVRFDDPSRVWFAGGHHDRVRALGIHDHFGAPVDEAVRAAHTGARPWRECTSLNGCCLLLRAAALEEVGPFRADYQSYVEDLELSLRLRRGGWLLGWVPAARLAHRVPRLGSEPSPMQLMLRDRNRRRLVHDHYSAPWRVAFALWFWPTRLVHIVRYALAGDGARARAIVDALAFRTSASAREAT